MKPINQAVEACEWSTITPRHGYPIIVDKSGRHICKTDCSISSSNWVEDTSEAQEHAALIVRAANLLDALTVVEESARNLINIMGWVPDGIHDEKHALKSALSKLSELKKSLNL